MALDVERVVDGSMAREEFLRRAGALEPLHLALPPPRRLMRILSSVVLPSPRSCRPSIPRSRAAALYDRKSSVTNRSGTKAYFFRSLRISFSVACLLRFDWTSTSRTSPRRPQPAKGRPFGCRFSDRPRPDAKSYEVLGDASVSRPRSSVRNDSPAPNRLVRHRHSAF